MHGLDLGRRRLEYYRGEQVFAVGRVLEGAVDRLLKLVGVRGKTDKGLGSPIAVAPIVVEHPPANGSVRSVLVGFADGRVDGEAARITLLAIGFDHRQADHFGDKFGVRRIVLERLPDDQGRLLGLLELLIVDEMQIVHSPKYVELAQLSTFRVRDRVVCRRSLGKSRQHRGFRDADLGQRLSKIDLRGCRKAVGALAEKDLVDIKLEYFILR